MKRLELEKNVLDLDYKKNLQMLNIVLISGIGAILAYLGALILTPNKFLIYTFAMFFVASLTYLLYRLIEEKLQNISEKISNL